MRRSSPEIDRNEILIENMESGLSNDGDEASSAFVGGKIHRKHLNHLIKK